MSRRAVLLMLGLTVTAAAPAAIARDVKKLPPETLRGPAHLLDQYPTITLATAQQRDAAERLLVEMREAARGWRDRRDAVAAGFGERLRSRRRAGDKRLLILHAEHVGYRRDGRYLDPQRPETLVYADAPGRPVALIGVMFSMPRGTHGPTPGGPITRWHTHRVCARGKERGLAPRPDGSCPPGTRSRQGSEMLHVWFTRDMRSAFAIHAPEPELCSASLLPTAHCAHIRHGHGG